MFGRRRRSSSHHQVRLEAARVAHDIGLDMQDPTEMHQRIITGKVQTLTSHFYTIQPLSTGASHSAQSAANHAFLNSQPSSNSLSSAAAAAALRSLSPTPTPVENVQTKRMVQRRASTQSQVSPLAARRSMSSEPLQRRNSLSSMTARTFREPSPRRPSSSSGPLNAPPVDVPPLPSLPSQYANRKLPPRRASSMQPQTRSPTTTPPRSTARGTSSDRGREGSSGVHSAHYRLSSLSTVPELERPASRSSINFSRPISPPATLENRPLGLDACAVREVPSPNVIGAQQSTSRVLEKPNITRPRTQAAGSSDGRKPTVSSGAPIGTAVAAAQAVSAQKATPRPEPDHARVERMDPGPDISVQEPVNQLPVAISTESEHPSSRSISEQWPSTVVEEEEPEDDATAKASQTRAPSNRLTSSSPTVEHTEALSTPQSSPKVDQERSPQQQAHLRQSSSPGRSARFAKWLSVSASGDQVHQPPPRSMSPVKSALKQPRGNSLSPDGRAGIVARGVHPPSEISDGTSVASDEGSRNAAKRKSVRVSFDDEAEVVGVAASPPTSPEEYVPDSPPSKTKSRMNWRGFGRKKPSDFATGDDDFEDVMKPRPELPSFGSVRGNRDGGQRAPIPDFSDNESTVSSDEDVRAPGGTISESIAPVDLSSRAPNEEASQAHGAKSPEQLSVGGTPSASEQDPTHYSNLDGATVGGLTEQQPCPGPDPNLTVPAIAVQPATPSVDERTSFDTTRSSMERYSNIPGGFPPSNSDRSVKSSETGTAPQHAGTAVSNPIDMDAEGESDDSVYSDAPEGIDGDGFGSINAIVDGRLIPRSSQPLETISESRETTPKAADRSTLVGTHSEDVTEQVAESARTVTPTQKHVDISMADSPSSVQSQSTPGHSTPPLPPKSKARVSQAPNGAAQLGANKQRRTVSVDGYGGSNQNDTRDSKLANGSPTGKTKQRPMSLGPAFQMNRPSTKFPNSLRRTPSNGSDSSSSFKRSSPSPRTDGPRTMRRTMRPHSTYAATAFPSDQGEFASDYRPLSSGSGTGTMRKTLRNPGAGTDRHSIFGTNKRAQAPRSLFGRGPGKGKKGSRFADSDDEGDGGRPQVYRSRFADSSDEDEPGSSNLRPVRGIPRRQGAYDGDSTELEDSSEEDSRAAPRPGAARPVTVSPPTSRGRDTAQPNMSGLAAVARQRGMTQRELEEFLMQPPRGRTSSLLTRLGLKKSRDLDNRVRKADVESPSRRDTPLERSRLEREQLREEGYVNGSRGVTTTTVTSNPYEPMSPSGKLHKKKNRFSIAGDSWPLGSGVEEAPPAPMPVAEQSNGVPPSALREQSEPAAPDPGPSNGVHVDEETPLGPIQETDSAQARSDVNDDTPDITTTKNNEAGPSARDVVIAGSGRKKARFSLLRKAFGRKT